MAKNRVVFEGRKGTIVGRMPAGMFDVRFDDSPHRVERRHTSRLKPISGKPARAMSNPQPRRPARRARWNPEDMSPAQEAYEALKAQFEASERTLAEMREKIRRVSPAAGRVVEADMQPLLTAHTELKRAYRLAKQTYEVEDLARRTAAADASAPLPHIPRMASGTVGSPEAYRLFIEQQKKAEEDAKAGRVRAQAKKVKEAKPPGTIRKGAPQHDLRTTLYDRGASWMTEADPPRLARDGRSYCGNPIDGVAYYLLVAEEKRWTPSWVKHADVLAAAAAAKADVSTPTKLGHFFLEKYIPVVERNTGVEIYGQKSEPAQRIRSKGKPLGTEYARRERKTGTPGALPDPKLDFSLVLADGEDPTFYRVSASVSPGREKLNRFSPFRPRKYVLPSPTIFRDADIAKYGALALALHAATNKQISISVAQMFIRSGAVFVNGRIVSEPRFNGFSEGTEAVVGLQEKSESSFFSWVETIVPIRARESFLAPCLTGDDLAVVNRLRTLRQLARRIESAFGRLDRLRSGTKGDVLVALAKLQDAFAAVRAFNTQLFAQIGEGNSIALRVMSIYKDTDFDPLNPQGVFNQALLDKAVAPRAPGRSTQPRYVSVGKDKEQLAGKLGQLLESDESPGAMRWEVRTVLERGQAQLQNAEAKLLGGSGALGAGEKYTAYVTYNPVLFELTRLFWPSARNKTVWKPGASKNDTEHGAVWGDMTAHMPELLALDEAGTYGHAARLVQEVAIGVRSEEELQGRLEQILSTIAGNRRDNVMQGFLPDGTPAPPGLYRAFLLNAHLGETTDQAIARTQALFSEPMDYLRAHKQAMERAVGNVLHVRRVGLPRATEPPKGDMPFYRMAKDRDPMHPDSAVSQHLQGDQDVREMIRQIDAAVADLNKKIGSG